LYTSAEPKPRPGALRRPQDSVGVRSTKLRPSIRHRPSSMIRMPPPRPTACLPLKKPMMPSPHPPPGPSGRAGPRSGVATSVISELALSLNTPRSQTRRVSASFPPARSFRRSFGTDQRRGQDVVRSAERTDDDELVWSAETGLHRQLRYRLADNRLATGAEQVFVLFAAKQWKRLRHQHRGVGMRRVCRANLSSGGRHAYCFRDRAHSIHLKRNDFGREEARQILPGPLQSSISRRHPSTPLRMTLGDYIMS